MARRRNGWMTLGLDAAVLGVEAAQVMGLRMARLAAGGPAADAEARRMVSEKIEAAASLQAMALTGALGATPAQAATRSLAHYRRKVRSNRRRLMRST